MAILAVTDDEAVDLLVLLQCWLVVFHGHLEPPLPGVGVLSDCQQHLAVVDPLAGGDGDIKPPWLHLCCPYLQKSCGSVCLGWGEYQDCGPVYNFNHVWSTPGV